MPRCCSVHVDNGNLRKITDMPQRVPCALAQINVLVSYKKPLILQANLGEHVHAYQKCGTHQESYILYPVPVKRLAPDAQSP